MAILLSFVGAKFDIPNLDWWRKRRDATGHRSEIFAYVAIARANSIELMGFDETKVNGISTCNLWCRIVNAQDEVSLSVDRLHAHPPPRPWPPSPTTHNSNPNPNPNHPICSG